MSQPAEKAQKEEEKKEAETEKKAPAATLARLWKNLKPHPLYIKKRKLPLEEYEGVVIINKPRETLKHPLLNFDLAKACDTILAACQEEPDPRMKRLIAGLRGIGGGKTRTIEELRCELNQRDNVVAIAVTFNSKWNLSDVELDDYEQPTRREGESCYAHAVIARMASVFFGVPFEQMRKCLSDEEFVQCARDSPGLLLRAVVVFMVSCLSESRSITNFVLLVDETAKGAEFIFNQYKNNDVTHVLRESLLDEPLFLADGANLHVGLVMTSLELGPIGQTFSGRAVHPLLFPSQLDPRAIVDLWWLNGLDAAKFPKRLIVAASVFATIPRLVEMAARSLNKVDDIEALVTHVQEMAKDAYPSLRLPDPQLMFAMVFQRQVLLTPEVMFLISLSAFTNSLTDFTTTTKIVPQSNLVLLMAAASKETRDTRVISALKTMFTFSPPLEQAGDALEILLYRWLHFRISIFVEAQESLKLTLATLFQLDQYLNRGLGDFFEQVMQTKVDIGALRGCDENETHLKYSSRENPAEFVTEMKDLQARKLVQVFLSLKKEAFDVLLTFGSALVFIDTKSREVDDEKAEDKVSRKNWVAQARHVTSIMAPTKLPWIYIYFTTHSVKLTFRDNVLTIGANLAQDFFGPVWPPYRALRSEFA